MGFATCDSSRLIPTTTSSSGGRLLLLCGRTCSSCKSSPSTSLSTTIVLDHSSSILFNNFFDLFFDYFLQLGRTILPVYPLKRWHALTTRIRSLAISIVIPTGIFITNSIAINMVIHVDASPQWDSEAPTPASRMRARISYTSSSPFTSLFISPFISPLFFQQVQAPDTQAH
jgi:hypothetical protein